MDIDGTLTSPPVPIPDLDGDQIPEILAPIHSPPQHALHLLPGSLSGRSSLTSPPPSPPSPALSTLTSPTPLLPSPPGDYDGDGTIEIALHNEATNTLWLLESLPLSGTPPHDSLTPDATLSLAAARPATAADLDGDGATDLIALSDAQAHIALGGAVDGIDLSLDGERLALAATHAAAADLDGDGTDDLVLGVPEGTSGRALAFTGGAPSAWRAEAPSLAVLDAVGPVAAGDLDGDGFADVIADTSGGGIVAVRGASALGGTIASGGVDLFLSTPRVDFGATLAAGDLDGDGLDDVIARSGPAGGSRVHWIRGSP